MRKSKKEAEEKRLKITAEAYDFAVDWVKREILS